MRSEYDFSKLRPREKKISPTQDALKTALSIRLDAILVEGIKERALELGLPYQTLINTVLTQYMSGKLVDDAVVKELETVILQLKTKS